MCLPMENKFESANYYRLFFTDFSGCFWRILKNWNSGQSHPYSKVGITAYAYTTLWEVKEATFICSGAYGLFEVADSTPLIHEAAHVES